jgi:hypothetical protein
MKIFFLYHAWHDLLKYSLSKSTVFFVILNLDFYYHNVSPTLYVKILWIEQTVPPIPGTIMESQYIYRDKEYFVEEITS